MVRRSLFRTVLGPIARPVAQRIDRRFDARLEAFAARLETHTANLSADQRAEIARIDSRLTLDVAVISEHLLGIERIARTVAAPAISDRLVIVHPGEPLPTTVAGMAVVAYADDGQGAWRRTDSAELSTLRIVVLPSEA